MTLSDVPWWGWAVIAVILFAMVLREQGELTIIPPFDGVFSFGSHDTLNGISRDPRKLLPAFAERVELLFRRMRERGFDPMLHEGFRSFDRAHDLAKLGVDDETSPHCYGAAVDIISKSRLWGDKLFFEALAEEAIKLRLYPGYHWSEPEPAHVQAVPATDMAEGDLRKSLNPNQYVKIWID